MEKKQNEKEITSHNSTAVMNIKWKFIVNQF